MKRNPFYDNTRTLLIFLVVFGHVIQPLIQVSAGVHTLYMWMYTFHMPAFILLAGFFAKGYGTKGYLLNLAKKLLLPYLIFQLLYMLFYYWTGDEAWYNPLWEPYWSLWFLISLFCWHLLLIWYKKRSPIFGITLAFAIGLAIGYIDVIGHTLSVSRTFFFFPFFLIGYWLSNEQVMRLKSNAIKVASVAIMLSVAVILHMAPDFDVFWLLGSKSYSELGMGTFGIFARLLVYIGGAVMTACVLSWIPAKQTVLTYIGSRTLYVYLLHGFFVQFFRIKDVFSVGPLLDVGWFAGLSMVLLAILSALLVFVLSSKWMMGLWQPILEGKTTILRNEVKEWRARTDQS